MSELDYSKIFASAALSGEKSDMPTASYLRGWGYLTESEPPPMEYFNYLQNQTDQKLLDLYNRIGSTTTVGSVYEALAKLEARINGIETGDGLVFKGTVLNYSDLPTENLKVGDTYNITNSDFANGIKAGDNVIWNGSAWDNLSGGQELSNYYVTENEIDDYFERWK